MEPFTEGIFIGTCIVFCILAWPTSSHIKNIAKELKLLRKFFKEVWKEMK